MEGYYYLHSNGELIYKQELEGTAADIRESSFARAMWPFTQSDREGAWRILIESLSAGARKERVMELASKWGCSDEDAAHYAERVHARIFMDGNAWCSTREDFINLQESPAGFGDTALEAMSELNKELGYVPRTMWGNEFKQLLVNE